MLLAAPAEGLELVDLAHQPPQVLAHLGRAAPRARRGAKRRPRRAQLLLDVGPQRAALLGRGVVDARPRPGASSRAARRRSGFAASSTRARPATGRRRRRRRGRRSGRPCRACGSRVLVALRGVAYFSSSARRTTMARLRGEERARPRGGEHVLPLRLVAVEDLQAVGAVVARSPRPGSARGPPRRGRCPPRRSPGSGRDGQARAIRGLERLQHGRHQAAGEGRRRAARSTAPRGRSRSAAFSPMSYSSRCEKASFDQSGSVWPILR